MSSIHFESTYDDSKLVSGIARSNQTVGQWAKNIQTQGAIADRAINDVQNRIIGLASVGFAAHIGSEIIQIRGQFQQLGIAFETMLGSKEKSNRLMAEQIALAQKTPFTLVDVATNTKQLLAMGIGYEKVMDTMKSLGDVAAGVSVPLSRIAINYGQVATLGKLQQREIRDFAMAGVPIIDELAKNMGKAKDEIMDMVTAGQVGFPEVERAFQTMSSEGGKFYNLMEKQNASVTGQVSNLTDKFQVMMNALGKSNEGLIYGGISGLTSLVSNYKEILDILEVLVITYGSVKAAQMAVSAYESAMSTIDAARTKIIEGKVAALQAEFAAQDAAAAQAVTLAAAETARTAKIVANETAQSTAQARVVAAKEANVLATQQLADAELELQIVQARNTAAYEAGFLTLKKSQNVKKEMKAVDESYLNLKKTERVLDKEITAETVVNQRIQAEVTRESEAIKGRAKIQGVAASRALMIANEEATASEIAMAAVNPWLLAGVAIAGIITLLMAFRKEVKTTEELVADLNKSVDAIGKQIELESAISKYESLKDKVGKTKEEQQELNKAIKTLSAIFPDAIGKTDQYGKAIDLVTEKLRNASAESRKNTKDIAEAAKVEAEAARQKLIQEKDFLQQELKRGRQITVATDVGPRISTEILSPEQALENKKRIADLDNQIGELGTTIQSESQKIYELASVGAEEFIAKNAKLFKEIGTYTREEALTARDELMKLYGTDGGRADAAIQKQAQALNDYANSIKTIKEEIAKTQKDLADGEEKLAKMRLPGYESTNPKKDIEEQEAVNKELKTKIESLTGIKEKEAKKELKTQQEKIDALRDLAQKEMEIMQSLEESKTAAIEDGSVKQRKVIEDSYKNQLLSIAKQKKDYLETLNKSKGLVSTDKNYVTELPDNIQSDMDQMAVNARQSRDNAIFKLDEDLVKKQNAIWDSATEAFISNVEKEKREVNSKYDNIIEQARLAGMSQADIDQFNANRQKELVQVSQNAIIKLSPIYQKAFGDIERYGTSSLSNLKKQMDDLVGSAKQINIDGKTMIQVSMPTDQIDKDGQQVKQVVNMTIEEFIQWKNKLNDITNKTEKNNPFSAVAKSGKAMFAAFKSGNKDDISSSVKVFTNNAKEAAATVKEWGDSIATIFGEDSPIGKAAKKVAEVAQGTVDLGSGIAKLASGDIIGGVTDTLKGIAELVTAFSKNHELSAEQIRQYESLIDVIGRVIDKQMELLSSLSGTDAVELSLEILDNIQKSVDAARSMGHDYLESRKTREHSYGYQLRENLKPYIADINALGVAWDGEAGSFMDLSAKQLEVIQTKLPEAWAQLDDQTQGYLQTIIDGTADIEKMKDALNEALTSLSFDSARSSLVDLLLSADTTMSDVANNFEGYMKKAIVNMITNKDLLPALTAWYQNFSDAMADGVLSDAEKLFLQAGYKSLYTTGKTLTDTALSVAGINPSAQSSTPISGITASLTEDTGSMIVGLATGIRIDIKSLLEIGLNKLDLMTVGVNHLSKIEKNTSELYRLANLETAIGETNRILKEKL